MIHYTIEEAMKNAAESWERHNMGRSPDQLGKVSYMLGHLKSAYERMYKDLPCQYKEINIPNEYKKVKA